MKKFLKQLAIFTVIVGVVTVISSDAFAYYGSSGGAQAGSDFKQDFLNALRGSVGTTGGLIISLVGLYMWIWNQVTWGLIVALGGALITAFPGIYNAVGEFGSELFQNSANLNPTPANSASVD